MSEEDKPDKSVTAAVASIAAFFEALREVFQRRDTHGNTLYQLSPASQHIQDMWRTGDVDGYNTAVNRHIRERRPNASEKRQHARAGRCDYDPM